MNNTSYILRNDKTGQFFNGTNFSEDHANKATRFDSAPSAEAVRLIWACPVRVIAITDEQIAKLDLSDDLEERAKVHNVAACDPRKAASSASASARLQKRAFALAREVYSAFPRWGAFAS